MQQNQIEEMQQELMHLNYKQNLIDKLKTATFDLSKLSNVLNNDIVKRLCVINQLQK